MIDGNIYRNITHIAGGSIRKPNGELLDLTDKQVEFFLKKVGAPVIILYKSSVGDSPAIVIPEQGTGQYKVTFKPDETVWIKDGIYEYGVIVRDQTAIVYAGGGKIRVLTTGG